MSKPSITNCPNTFFNSVHNFSCCLSIQSRGTVVLYYQIQFACVQIRHTPFQVVIAVRSHLFPFRTEKLSSLAPMVLQCGRVGSRLLLSGSLDYESSRGFFCHADFADDADFFFAAFLCCFSFFPTDFTDGHRF